MIAKSEIKPVRRQPISQQVVQQLLNLIKSGDLKAGQKLPPERELAETLQVSRPSVREALSGLSLLGVVNIRQGGGVYISSLDPESLLGPLHFFIALNDENLEELFEARILIESAVAALAASRISDEQLTKLETLVNLDNEILDEPVKFIESDVEFHWTIFNAANNSFLNRMATSLQILGRASREITAYIPGVLANSIEDHRRIYAALKAHDPEQASAAMRQHLWNVRDASHKTGSKLE